MPLGDHNSEDPVQPPQGTAEQAQAATSTAAPAPQSRRRTRSVAPSDIVVPESRTQTRPRGAEDPGPRPEADPVAAVTHFWECSMRFALRPQTDAAKEELLRPISVAEMVDCWRDFRSAMDLVTVVCGCCGCRETLPRGQQVLWSVAELLSIVGSGNVLMTFATENADVHVCHTCNSTLSRADESSRIPPVSIARGFRFASDFPADLTAVELACIRRVSLYATIIKLSRNGRKFVVTELDSTLINLSGHCISFANDATTVLGQLQRDTFPRTDLSREVNVVFIGRREEYNHSRNSFLRRFHVRPRVVLNCLLWLKLNNRFYVDVRVDESPAVFSQLEALPGVLFDNAVVDEDVTTRNQEFMRAANVADTQNREGVDALEHVYVQDAAQHEGLQSDAFDVLARTVLRVADASTPVSEFTENKFLLMTAFPHLFAGMNEDLLSDTVLSDKFVKQLLSYRDGRFEDPLFAFYLYDQKQRADAARSVAAKARGTGKELEKLKKLLDDPQFQHSLVEALQEPEGRVARVVRRRLSPFLYATSSTTMFSSLRRASAAKQMEAEVLFRGLPWVYFTVSPADMDFTPTLRLCDGITHLRSEFKFTGTEQNPSLAERKEMVVRNPCAAAYTFHHLMKAIIQGLVKIPLDRKKAEVLTERGIFGLGSAVYGVIECQGRGALHMHALFWGGVAPEHLQAVAHIPKCQEQIRHFVDSMAVAWLPTAYHLMVGKVEAKYRGALHPCPEPGTMEFFNHVWRTAVAVQVHDPHRPGCFKNGPFCRYGLPAPMAATTGIRAIKVGSYATPAEAPKPLAKGLPVTTYELDQSAPLQRNDPRAVICQLQRPTALDQCVAEFCGLLTGATGSNTSVTPLGLAGQARNILYYLVKYMSKDASPLHHAISCLKQAQIGAREHPSTVPGRCVEHTVLLKMLNHISARAEVTPQMIFSVLLGERSEYSTSTFTFLFPRTAISYCTQEEDTEGEDEVDEEADAPEVAAAEEDEEEEDLTIRGDDGGVIYTTPQHVNYAFRGPQLAVLSLYEYAALVDVVKSTGIAPTRTGGVGSGAGRPTNAVFNFAAGHPQSGAFVQRIRSMHKVPVLSAFSPPCDPGEGRSGCNKRKQAEYAAFVSAVFLPWSSGDRLKSYSGLQRVVQHMRHACELPLYQKARLLVIDQVAGGYLGKQSDGHAEFINRLRFNCAGYCRNIAESIAQDYDVNVDEIVEELERERNTDNAAEEDPEAEEYVKRMTTILDDFFGAEPTTKARAAIDPWTSIAVNGREALATFKNLRSRRTTAAERPQVPIASDFLHESVGQDYFSRGFRPEADLRIMSTLMPFQRSAMAYIIGKLQERPTEKERIVFVHGGPGSGKTFLVNALVSEYKDQIVVTATTGAASTLYSDALTLHKALGLTRVKAPGRNGAMTDPPCAAVKRSELQDRFRDRAALVIDEASMLDKVFLRAVDLRLQTITQQRVPFGGMLIVLVGDLFQLEPVNGIKLFGSKLIGQQADYAIEVLELEGQVRAAADPQHCELIRKMRSTATTRDALQQFLGTVEFLKPEDSDFRFATVLVSSNAERHAVNRAQVRAFATANGQALFQFEANDKTTFLFCAGAPAVLTTNVWPERGMANGTRCTLHSLSFEAADRIARTQDHTPGTIITTPRPATINVQLANGDVVPIGEVRDDRQLSFPVELAFALTLHKAQGATLGRVVVQLNRRPRKLKPLSHSALYVALTRVKTSSDLRIFPPEAGFGLHYLTQLKPSAGVEAWCASHRVELSAVL